MSGTRCLEPQLSISPLKTLTKLFIEGHNLHLLKNVVRLEQTVHKIEFAIAVVLQRFEENSRLFHSNQILSQQIP